MTDQSYFSKRWLVPASVVAGLVQIGIGAFVIEAADLAPIAVMGGLSVLCGAWMMFLAYWTRVTPLVRIDDQGVHVRAAIARKPRHAAFADITSVAQDRGWLKLQLKSASEIRVPYTALDAESGERLLSVLRQRIAPA